MRFRRIEVPSPPRRCHHLASTCARAVQILARLLPISNMTTLGVEPGLSRPQRDVLTTRRCGRMVQACNSNQLQMYLPCVQGNHTDLERTHIRFSQSRHSRATKMWASLCGRFEIENDDRSTRVGKTLCPSGLRGWTQVPLAQAAWVQIPQLSANHGSTGE